MRPVEKGAAPAVYTNYQDALPHLRSRLGDFCSYCERQIETNLAVEHIQPKLHVPALRNAWSNFLLSCGNCNSSKGDTPVELAAYLWPDRDNTLRGLEYAKGGLIDPNPTLPASIQARARALIRLTGLDKYPGNPGRRPSSKDLRWLKREQVWKLAELNRQRLIATDTPGLRESIVETALGRGLFSIWWTVFAGDVDMRRRLRQAFLGTHSGCFDANEDVVPRAGGQI